MMENNIELLSPSGNLEAFYSSINAGCNAIYLGGKLFSARAYASNFSIEEIGELIKYAHRRDVKVYVTCNTLIFENEFLDAIKFIDELYKRDVDAILIQDLGLAHYLHITHPDLILHASTQLNCHNIAEAKALKELGFKRIVLAREASLDLVRQVKELGLEVEVFVHGALCVSYSGNCLMSSFIGGRSGNRGKCAQPCRNKMKVISSNKESDEFAISTKDLNTIEYIDKLIESGVDSLKIEGRMKRKEYVYQVVSSYRKAIDSYFNNSQIDTSDETLKMQKLFNRQFTKGYLFNEVRSKVLNQVTSSHQGIIIGKVIKENKDYVDILLKDDLHVGDGIRFNNSNQDGQIVQKMFVNKVDVKSAYINQIVSLKKHNVRVKVNDEVIKTSDNYQLEEIDKLIDIPYRLPLIINVVGKLNNPLKGTFIYRDKLVEVYTSNKLEKASKISLNEETLKDKLSKLGDTQFYLDKLEINLEDNLFISLKELNELRRLGVEKLSKLMENKNHYSLDNIKEYYCELDKIELTNNDIYKVENEEQFKLFKDKERVYVQNELLVKKLNNKYHALYRINELDKDNALDNELITYPKIIEGKNVFTSPYFNLVNSYSLDYAYSKGIKGIILSLELSKTNIKEMIDNFINRHHFKPNLGALVYGYTDLMIMKSCPIGAMEKVSVDHCSLCKKDNYYLLDQNKTKLNMLHDENCVTRILSSSPIYLIDKIEELKELGISFSYYDFTFEDKNEIKNILHRDIKSSRINRGHFLSSID